MVDGRARAGGPLCDRALVAIAPLPISCIGCPNACGLGPVAQE